VSCKKDLFRVKRVKCHPPRPSWLTRRPFILAMASQPHNDSFSSKKRLNIQCIQPQLRTIQSAHKKTKKKRLKSNKEGNTQKKYRSILETILGYIINYFCYIISHVRVRGILCNNKTELVVTKKD